MVNIIIGRYENDPEAQGVVRAEDGAWQLVIDKDGFPHLYVLCPIKPEAEGDPTEGLVNIDDMLIGDMTIPDLMKSTFDGRLSPEDEAAAHDEFIARKKAHCIPCPRD